VLVLTPRTSPTDDELAAWRTRRDRTDARVRELLDRGLCWQCEDERTGEQTLGERFRLLEEPRIRAELAADPRSPGHAIVVWTPHVQDFTELDADETAALFDAARRVARALQRALAGVDRVYLVTMSDGPVNHLHLQLIPRYAGVEIGSRRLVDPRGPLLDGAELAGAIRAEVEPAR
jgi:diadenosine tetraphosphate (Ap4A) HIT family hydrolase